MVCFFSIVPVFVAVVGVRSSTLGSSSWIHLLHGLVLLPSRISGKMTITLDHITIIAMLVASMLSLCRVTYHLLYHASHIAMSGL